LIGELVHLVGFFGLGQDVLLDFQGDSVGQVGRLLPEGP
jgi:hypothetical protein